MSPEQKAGGKSPPAAIIYALGLVLHEMFTGKARTNTQSNPTDLVKDLDPAIERLILRCLEEEPEASPVLGAERGDGVAGWRPDRCRARRR